MLPNRRSTSHSGYWQLQRLGPIPKPHRLVALLLVAALGGCSFSNPTLPVVLYVAISVEEDQKITSNTRQSFRQWFTQVIQKFGALHSDVLIQTAVYKENQLTEQLRLRDKSGLGPDLIFSSGEQATALLAAGLVDPMPEIATSRAKKMAMLTRDLRNSRGQLSGQPLGVFPQIACFNKRRLKTAPKTLKELVSIGAEGQPIGLALQFRQLIWTAGALGALPGLIAAAENRQPSPAEEQRILGWLTSLQQANNQRGIDFFPDQASLRDRLVRGELAWVSCSSTDLQTFMQDMGTRLGVAALPNGPKHPASPLNRMQVLSLGRNSSPRQREMALALTEFSVTPLVQRNLTLASLNLLPVHPHLNVPAQSSQFLAALVEAKRQGERSEALLAHLHGDDPRVSQLDEVLVQLLFDRISPDAATQQLIAVLRLRQ